MVTFTLFRLLKERTHRQKDRRRTVTRRKKGKTVGLLLRLSKDLRGTGKLVILDSSSCVLPVAQVVIKKRRYWTKHVVGVRIKDHFEGNELGAVDGLQARLDGVNFAIIARKDGGTRVCSCRHTVPST
jgi:hypothetical protein